MGNVKQEKRKMQKPVEPVVTEYARSRERLLQAKEAEIQALCTATGMDYDAAKKAVDAKRKAQRYTWR